jgi:surface protein
MFLKTPVNTEVSNWDMSSAITTREMFAGCTNFNNAGSPNINNWDVLNVTNMESMFSACIIFNQPIGSWITSSVTNMQSMFSNCSLFNRDISSWDVSNVVNMDSMFSDTVQFEQNLGGWDISNVTSMVNMLANVGLNTTNYDNLLIGWASLPSVQPNVTFDASNSFYSASPSAAATARNILTSPPNNWTITDAGPI